MKYPWIAAALGSLALAPALQESEDEWTQAELEQETAAILKDLEQMRGESFLRPVEVRVATKEDLLEYVKQRTKETYPPERMAADETIGKMLGVLDPDMDLWETTLALLESQVGGFYDPASDSFSLMGQFPKGIAPAILAHELDHALDDQLFDIDGKLEGIADVTDRAAAYWCVVEGSGQNVGSMWVMQNLDRVDLSSFASFQAETQAGLDAAPQWLWKPLIGAYFQGASFLVRKPGVMAGAATAAKNEDIRAAFEDPPRSTEQVIHPEKYWDPELVDEPREVAVESEQLPDGWEVVREDVLGELLLAIVATTPASRASLDLSNPATLMAISFTNELASGWGGDRVVLVANEDARVMRLVTVWDTERDAAEFYGGMSQILPDIDDAVDAMNPSRKTKAGATLEYGAADEVILTSYYGIERRDLKKVLPALRWSSAGS
jgi:hypothetical protein